MPKHNTDEPILVLIRRGRKGRGFTVSPVEDVANPAMCTDSGQIGEVIVEMLDDENQPRVNVSELLSGPSASDNHHPQGEDDDYDGDSYDGDDEGDDRGGDGIFDGVNSAADPADQLLGNIFAAIVTKGRDMSTKKVKSRSRRPKTRGKRSR